MFINRKTLFALSNIENVFDYSDFCNNDFAIEVVTNLLNKHDLNNEKYNEIYNDVMFELYEMSCNIEEYNDVEIKINAQKWEFLLSFFFKTSNANLTTLWTK